MSKFDAIRPNHAGTVFYFEENLLIPSEKATGSLGRALIAAQAPLDVAADLSEPQKIKINLVRWQWHVCRHLLCSKNLKSKHKVPAGKAYRDALEPQVAWLNSLFNLCVHTHAYQGGLSTPLVNPKTQQPYADAGQLFELILQEMEAWAVEDALRNSSSQRRPLPSRKTSPWKPGETYRKQPLMGLKESVIIGLRQTRDFFKNLENPFNPKLQPHEFALIEAATSLAEENDVWRKDHWKPMVREYANYVRGLERGQTGILEEVNDKVLLRFGRGRQTFVKSFSKPS